MEGAFRVIRSDPNPSHSYDCRVVAPLGSEMSLRILVQPVIESKDRRSEKTFRVTQSNHRPHAAAVPAPRVPKWGRGVVKVGEGL